MRLFPRPRFSYAGLTAMTLLTLGLAACGGGGGSSSSSNGGASNSPILNASFSDGLDNSGAASGTVVIGTAPTSQSILKGSGVSTVALANDGRALAVWSKIGTEGTYSSYTAGWNQTDPGGTWGAERTLAAVQGINTLYEPLLKMNASGNAVFGWTSGTAGQGNKAARFYNVIGWEATTYDANPPGQSASKIAAAWDLQMLDDNGYVFSGLDNTLALTGFYYYDLLLQPASGALQSVLQSENVSGAYMSSYFASNADGSGRLFWIKPVVSSTLSYDIRTESATVAGSSSSPATLANFSGICLITGDPNNLGFIAATSPSSYSAVAVVNSNASGGCDLDLIRVNNTTGAALDQTRMNAAGTTLAAQPALLMDQQGNALAVWLEQSGTGSSASFRLMWASATAGNTWSVPQPVISNLSSLGALSAASFFSIAMNANGQVVAAIPTFVTTPVGLGLEEYISYGRFSFAGGWSTWTRAANMADLRLPKVAINSSNTAVLVYAANPTNRSSILPRTASSTINVYALRF